MIRSLFFTALIVFLITVLVIGALVLIFTIFPFKYIFKAKYENYAFSVKFNYIMVDFSLYLSVRHGIKYRAVIFNRIIADSDRKKEVKNDKKEDNSIADTEFIENKDLEDFANANDKLMRELFISAKKRQHEKSVAAKLEHEIENDESLEISRGNAEKRVFNIIDLMDKVLPKDLIDVMKIVTREVLSIYSIVKPKKVEVDINAGFDDPYLTGLMLAFATPIYATLGDDLNIKPSFDKSVFSARLIATRRPVLLFMIIPILNLIMNKRFRDIVFKGSKYRKDLVKVTR